MTPARAAIDASRPVRPPKTRWIVVGLALLVSLACATERRPAVMDPTTATTASPLPLIIAHRGASGHRPEHTLAAYELGVRMGADFLEPDLVITRDGVLVARHENEIGGTTNVAERFASRRASKVIDGRSVTGWFVEDFTLAELRTLRARERLDSRSRAYDDRFPIPTFDEILDLRQRLERELGRPIGVYPETKHPAYFASIGLPLEPPLLRALAERGYRTSAAPVIIQSFETANLRALRSQTGVRLVQLFAAGAAPPDLAAAGDGRTLADLLGPTGLREIAGYADGVGVQKELILPRSRDGHPLGATSLIADAHAAGLFVHAWTFRSDPPFLAAEYAGDPGSEYLAFAALGVDGVFTDFPDHAVAALRPNGPDPAARPRTRSDQPAP